MGDDDSYEKIREEATKEPDEKEKPEEPKVEPEEPKVEPEKAEKPKAEKPKRSRSDQPRMICEGCGRSYSIHTKRHVCRAPNGFEKKESPKQTLAPPPNPPTPPAIPGPAERQLTLSDVTEFLFAESKARRQQRRDDLLAKMF